MFWSFFLVISPSYFLVHPIDHPQRFPPNSSAFRTCQLSPRILWLHLCSRDGALNQGRITGCCVHGFAQGVSAWGSGSGWWLTYPSEKYSQFGWLFPIYGKIWKNKKCSKPPTRGPLTALTLSSPVPGLPGLPGRDRAWHRLRYEAA